MMTRDDEKVVGGTIVAAALAAGIVYLVLQLLPDSLALSWSGSAWIIVGMILAVVMLGVGFWCETQSTNEYFLTLAGVAPVAAATVWGGLWPAMEEWGAIGPAFLGVPPPVAWWASPAIHWAGLAIILVGGYYWLYRRQQNG